MQIYPITQTDPPTFPLRREKGRVLLWNRNSRPLSPQTSTFDVRVFPETIVLRRLPSSQNELRTFALATATLQYDDLSPIPRQ